MGLRRGGVALEGAVEGWTSAAWGAAPVRRTVEPAVALAKVLVMAVAFRAVVVQHHRRPSRLQLVLRLHHDHSLDAQLQLELLAEQHRVHHGAGRLGRVEGQIVGHVCAGAALLPHDLLEAVVDHVLEGCDDVAHVLRRHRAIDLRQHRAIILLAGEVVEDLEYDYRLAVGVGQHHHADLARVGRRDVRGLVLEDDVLAVGERHGG